MLGAAVVAAAVLALAALALAAMLTSPLWVPLWLPTPRRGSPATLPNGLAIQQWTATETDILFKEIWGPASCYSKGGRVRFAPGMTIVDCGANIGLFSLFAARECGGRCRVLSIEPIPSTHAVLRDNAASASTGAMAAVLGGGKDGIDIVAVNVAVGDVPRGKRVPATFHHHPNLSIWSTSDAGLASDRVARIVTDFSHAWSKLWLSWLLPTFLFRAIIRQLLVSHFARTEDVNVTVVRTGDVLRGLGPGAPIGVLKVDVEGAEIEVLRGIDAEQWPHIEQVVMEVENFAAVRTAERLLRAQGFSHIHWEASEQDQGAATSQVSMVYASRETHEQVEARMRERADGGAAEEDPEAVVMPTPIEAAAALQKPRQRRGSVGAATAAASTSASQRAAQQAQAEMQERVAARVASLGGIGGAASRGRSPAPRPRN